MKEKIMMTILGAIVIILSISAGIMAFTKQPSVMDRMKKFDECETVENISQSNMQRSISVSDITKQNTVKEYMKENKLIEDDESDFNIQLITNNISSEKYYRMKGNGAVIDIIQDTGELRSYTSSKPTKYISGSTYDVEKTERVSKKILESNELFRNNQNYEFIEVTESTTYYPTAWFKDNVNNKLLFMILNPDNEEIVVVGTKAIAVSENNEIKINEETAKSIAMNKLGKSQEDILRVEQKEVVPNQMYLEAGYYSQLNIKRNAYVITFNTVSKLQVYVDATTGEVIGGNGVW